MGSSYVHAGRPLVGVGRHGLHGRAVVEGRRRVMCAAHRQGNQFTTLDDDLAVLEQPFGAAEGGFGVGLLGLRFFFGIG